MFLTKAISARVECNTKLSCNGGIIGAGVCKDTVALTDKSFCKELAEVAEAHNGNLQSFGFGDSDTIRNFGFVFDGLNTIYGGDSDIAAEA